MVYQHVVRKRLLTDKGKQRLQRTVTSEYVYECVTENSALGIKISDESLVWLNYREARGRQLLLKIHLFSSLKSSPKFYLYAISLYFCIYLSGSGNEKLNRCHSLNPTTRWGLRLAAVLTQLKIEDSLHLKGLLACSHLWVTSDTLFPSLLLLPHTGHMWIFISASAVRQGAAH